MLQALVKYTSNSPLKKLKSNFGFHLLPLKFGQYCSNTYADLSAQKICFCNQALPRKICRNKFWQLCGGLIETLVLNYFQAWSPTPLQVLVNKVFLVNVCGREIQSMQNIAFISDTTTVRCFFISFLFCFDNLQSRSSQNHTMCINTISRVAADLCFSQRIVIR